MKDALTILLQSKLDVARSIQNINKQIEQIEKQINKVDIETNLNTESITKETEKINKQFEKISQTASKPIDIKAPNIDKTNNNFKELNEALSKVSRFDPETMPLHSGMEIIGYSVKEAGNGMKQFTQTLNDGQDHIITYNGVLNESIGKYEVLGRTVRQSTRDNQTFIKELDIAIRRSVTWALGMTAVYGSLRKLQEGVGFIQELDKELTQVSVITGKTRSETRQLAQEYADLGEELNRTVTDISAVNTELVRQGLSMEEAENRLQTVMKLNAVSGIDTDVKDTLKIITSSVNAMGEDAERAADIILKASQISASSVEEIGEAFTKVASSAKTSGMDMTQSSAILAGLLEVTQESASSLGNSLKTLIARFNKINEETGETNEELNDVQKAFESVGIAFTDTHGQIRPVYDLFSDMSAIWSTLDKNTKNYIATMAAGVRQQNRFFAIMDNMERIHEIQEDLTKSSGTLQKSYKAYTDSVEASANRMKLAFEQLWLNTINSDAIKYFYDFMTMLVKVVDQVGLLNVAIFALTTRFAGLSTSLLITPIAFGIGKLINYFRTAKQEQEEFASSIVDSSKEIQASLTDTRLSSSLIDEYERLNKQLENNEITVSKVAETKERLSEIELQLLELYPDLVTQSDLENNSLQEKIPLLKEVADTKSEQLKEELSLEAQRAATLIDSWEEEKQILEEQEQKYQKQLEIEIEARSRLVQLKGELDRALEAGDEDAIDNIMQKINEVADAIGYYFPHVAGFQAFFYDEFNEGADKVKEQLDTTREELQEVTEQIDTFYQNKMLLSDVYTDFAVSMQNFNSIAEPTTNQIKEQTQALENMKTEAKKSMDAQAYAAFSSEIDKAISSLNNLEQSMDDYADSALSAEEKQQKLNEAFEESHKVFQDTTTKIQSLYAVQNELNKSGEISADVIDEIINKHPELIQYLGSRKALEDAITEAIKIQESVQSQALTNMLENDATYFNEKLRATVLSYNEVFEAYGVDVSKFRTAAEVKDAIDGILVNEISKRWSKMYTGTASSLLKTISMVESTMVGLYSRGEVAEAEQMRRKLVSLRQMHSMLKGIENQYSYTASKINLPGTINLGGIKTPSTKKRSSTKKASSTKSNIDSVSDAIRKFLDNLENKTALTEFNISMNELDQAYYEATGNMNKANELRAKEINLYKKLNRQLNSNIKSVKNKMKSTKKNTENYRALEDALFNYTQQVRKNEIAIKDLQNTLKEYDRELRNRVIEGQNLVLEAVRSRVKAEYEANKKILQDKIDTLNKEKALLREEYNRRQEQKQEEKKKEELRKLEERYNKLSKDNSGMYEQEKLQLQQQIAELREEIYDDELLKQIENREKAIDDQIDKYQQEIDMLDAHYEEMEDTYREYWTEVESIMKGSQSSIINFLTNNLDEYKRAGELQKEAYLEGWGELYKEVKDIQSGKTKTASQIQKSVGSSTGKNYASTSTGSSSGSSSSSSKSSSSAPKFPGNIRKGSRGEDVKRIQRIVGVKADGIYGAKTEAAVKAYQRKHGLAADGIVGIKTWTKMFGGSGYSSGASSFPGNLRRGSTGSAVKEVQKKVGVTADGIYGSKTESAVKAYQRKHGLSADGIVGIKTWDSMFGSGKSGSSTPKYPGLLRRGSRGEAVKQIQRKLGVTADGIFGAKTEAAVKAFQKKNKLAVDGLVGSKTWAKLFKGYLKGGLVDYTGLAMVHGKPDEPEAFLNAKQTVLVGELANTLSKMPQNAVGESLGRQINLSTVVNVYPGSIDDKYTPKKLGQDLGRGIEEHFESTARRAGLTITVSGSK